MGSEIQPIQGDFTRGESHQCDYSLLDIFIIVYYHRRKRRPNTETSKLWAEPSPAPTSSVGVYATASAIDEAPNQKQQNSNKTQQQNTYVNASPDIVYSAVDKEKKSERKSKANSDTSIPENKEAKNVNDDETMMFENNTLYSSTAGRKDAGDTDNAEVKHNNEPIMGQGNDQN